MVCGSSNGSMYTQLFNRSVVRLSGEQLLPFLQGLTTNDVRYFDNSLTPHAQLSTSTDDRPLRSLFSLLLDRRGRIQHDILLYRLEEKVLALECEKIALEKISRLLKTFKLRKKVDIEPVADWTVFAIPDHRHSDAIDFGEFGDFVFPDPRLRELGFRALIHNNANLRERFENLLKSQNFERIESEDYAKFRYHLGVPEGSGDLKPGTALPLQCNGDYLNGISFHKGCYIGQELTARTHHTGVVRRRLMPIQLMAAGRNFGEIAESANIFCDGEAIGKFVNGLGDVGLALLKVDAVTGTSREKQKCALEFGNEDGTEFLDVEVWKPDWWSNLNVRGFQPCFD